MLGKKLKYFLLTIDQCLFEGAEELLKALKDRGDKLVLMSLGNAEWQRMKISNSQILKNNFDDLLIEENDKTEHEFFSALSDTHHQVVIYNDKPEEGLKMKNFLDALGVSCHLVIIKGPYSPSKNEVTELGIEYAEDFSELAKNALESKLPPISYEFKIH